jgi:predicted nuclease with TOPRIM domain
MWAWIAGGSCAAVILIIAGLFIVPVLTILWSKLQAAAYRARTVRAQNRMLAVSSERTAAQAETESRRQVIQAETELKRLRADQALANRQSDERIKGLDRERAALDEAKRLATKRIAELERQVKSLTDKLSLSEEAARSMALEADEAKADARRLEDENRHLRQRATV